jgi:hypothetical protein
MIANKEQKRKTTYQCKLPKYKLAITSYLFIINFPKPFNLRFYRGRFDNGTEFETNVGKDPWKFSLGTGGVFKFDICFRIKTLCKLK